MFLAYSLRTKIALRLCLAFMAGLFVLGYISTSFLHQQYLEQFKTEHFNRVSNYAAIILKTAVG
ncbi:MAG: hypothetical protein JXR59_05135 [Desulfuromonadaceae bacterium]|nr:hypothetical protein [Desulfuromonadaceae bacterium]